MELCVRTPIIIWAINDRVDLCADDKQFMICACSNKIILLPWPDKLVFAIFTIISHIKGLDIYKYQIGITDSVFVLQNL